MLWRSVAPIGSLPNMCHSEELKRGNWTWKPGLVWQCPHGTSELQRPVSLDRIVKEGLAAGLRGGERGAGKKEWNSNHSAVECEHIGQLKVTDHGVERI